MNRHFFIYVWSCLYLTSLFSITSISCRTQPITGVIDAGTGGIGTVTQTTSTYGLDKERAQVQITQHRRVMGLVACCVAVAVGWSLLLLLLDAPRVGVWRGVLVATAIGLMAAPIVVVIFGLI